MRIAIHGFLPQGGLPYLGFGYSFYDETTGYFTEHVQDQIDATAGPLTKHQMFTIAEARALQYASDTSRTIAGIDWDSQEIPGYVSGVAKYDVMPYVASAAVAGGAGVVRMYLTDDGTSGGNAVFSEIFADSIQPVVWDGANSYVPSSVSVDTNRKYVDITMKKLAFTTGLAGLLTVLVGTSYAVAPNGTTVKATVLGRK